MRPKRIIYEPTWALRAAARESMKGRGGLLFVSSFLYLLCLFAPIIIIEQTTGFWDVTERMMNDYYTAMMSSMPYEAMEHLATAYAGEFKLNIGTILFLLLIPGPLTLGISRVWLRVLRGAEASADMVFTGFNNFARIVSMDTLRRIMIVLLSFLFIIPGAIMYYRYGLTFLLMLDDPGMGPFEALSTSRYYMKQNKGNRFLLDLSFFGWFAISYIAHIIIGNIISFLLVYGDIQISLFWSMLISAVLFAVIFAPILAYRGVTAVEYYHRVICRDPREQRPKLTYF